jgi:hypothetical protein
MTDEVERIWKEAVVAYLNYCADICLEEIRKTMKNLS